MVKQRWGALSVRDHIDAAALAADVVLYDKLVIPVPPGDEGDKEWNRWVTNGWKPELLRERLDNLGKLAVQEPWWDELKRKYDQRMEIFREQEGYVKEWGFLNTPWVLADKLTTRDITVIPAYRSTMALEDDLLFHDRSRGDARTTLLLGQSLTVPADADPEKALKKAIELSKDKSFQDKRTNLYRWQAEMKREGMNPEEMVTEMNDLIQDYNSFVEAACKRWRRKIVFTLIGSVISIIGGIPNPLPVGGALMTLAGLWTLDRRPEIDARHSEPAAMFHDVQGLWEELTRRGIGRRILDRIR